MAIKYTNIFFKATPKFTQIGIFGMKYIPSGNPGHRKHFDDVVLVVQDFSLSPTNVTQFLSSSHFRNSLMAKAVNVTFADATLGCGGYFP
jgi:hypothetical protein